MIDKRNVQLRIDEIMADERLHYKIATIIGNAPLALVQLSMEVELKTLYWVLEKSMPKIEREKVSE